MAQWNELIFTLPDWIQIILPDDKFVFTTVEDRMRFVIELARLNVRRETGGPFGAGVFESQSGRLLAVGVNLVEACNCSLAHAEMVALSLAQKKVGSFDLGRDNDRVYELVTSTEPCAMCLGAIPWSGIRRLVCGAREEDARSIGFDEGDKPENWIQSLDQRGIGVLLDVLREEARDVLQLYREMGGLIYNSRQEE